MASKLVKSGHSNWVMISVESVVWPFFRPGMCSAWSSHRQLMNRKTIWMRHMLTQPLSLRSPPSDPHGPGFCPGNGCKFQPGSELVDTGMSQELPKNWILALPHFWRNLSGYVSKDAARWETATWKYGILEFVPLGNVRGHTQEQWRQTVGICNLDVSREFCSGKSRRFAPAKTETI
jgi:hypothetical protein